MVTMSTTTSIAVIATLLVTGGTAITAETTKPGDILYPVKTEVNERIVSGLQFSNAARADLEVNLAIRRLKELEDLSVENKLNAENRNTLQERFTAHHKNALIFSEKAAAKGNIETSADVVAQYHMHLAAREQAILKLSSIHMSDDVKNELNSFIATTTEAKSEARQQADIFRQEILETEESAKVGIDTATAIIDELRVDIDSTVDLSAEARGEAEASLQNAAERLEKAEEELQNKAFMKAKNYASEAEDYADKSALNIQKNIDADAAVEIEAEIDANADTQLPIHDTSTEIDADIDVSDDTLDSTVKGALSL